MHDPNLPGGGEGKPSRPIIDYLYVDCHLGDYGPPPQEPLKLMAVNGMLPERFPPYNGSTLRIHYQFGSWNVFVPWPTVWLLKGQSYVPATNRYGFAPSAEFGNPSFSGETMTKTNLTVVAPFTYAIMGGGTYTPEVDFIFGEATSPTKMSQAMKAVQEQNKDVREVVRDIIGRK